MSQIVQEPVAQALALVGTRYEACDIQQFNGNTPGPVDTGSVIWLASFGKRSFGRVRKTGS